MVCAGSAGADGVSREASPCIWKSSLGGEGCCCCDCVCGGPCCDCDCESDAGVDCEGCDTVEAEAEAETEEETVWSKDGFATLVPWDSMCTVVASSATDLGPTDAAGDDEGGEGMRESRSTAEDEEGALAAARWRGRGCDRPAPGWPADSLAWESISATVKDCRLDWVRDEPSVNTMVFLVDGGRG